MGLLGSQADYFGLDIGTTGIRLVELRHSGGNPALATYGDLPIPQNLTTSDAPTDQQKVSDVVARLVQEAKVSTKNVVCGIPSSQAFATVITTPKLNKNELGKAMKLQADQYIPMAVDQVKLDWHVIDDGGQGSEMKVLLVAAPNSVVNKYLSIVEKAGLELAALEINAVALVRSLMPTLDIAVGILDIGSIATDITIAHQRSPKLIRSVNVGGSTFIRSVSQNLGLEEEQARQFLVKFGLTQTKLEGQILKALKASLDLLTDEIAKSIKFFSDQNPTVKLEKFILTGGPAALPELPTYLANATGLPVEIGNPWAGVSYPASMQDKLSAIALSYSVAVGLAQRAII